MVPFLGSSDDESVSDVECHSPIRHRQPSAVNDGDDEETPPPKRRRINSKTRDPCCFVKFPKPEIAVVRRSSEVLGEACGMHGIHIRRGFRLGIPMWIWTCIMVLMKNKHIDCTQRYHCIECYAGAATIYTGFMEQGLNSAKLDKSYSDKPEFDFTTLSGFINLIWHMICLRYRGLNFHAVVCSTWIFMSMASTGRTQSRPTGNLSSPAVISANLMVVRMCLMIRLGAARFCRWAVEQPATSCLPRFHRVRALQQEPSYLMCGDTTIIRTNMYAFGGPTLKPTIILGNPWVRLLERRKPAKSPALDAGDMLVKKSIDKNGVRRVTGNGKKLKESQEYPPGFGRAVCRHFLDSYTESKLMAGCMSDLDPDETDVENDDWNDALHGHSIEDVLTAAANFRTPTP